MTDSLDPPGNGTILPQLTPGTPQQMLREAIQFVKTLAKDADRRADAFEGLAKQIAKHTGNAWSAARGTASDGSHLFLGRQGEGLIVSPEGLLYRGSLGKGIDITSTGLRPDYNALKALD